MRRVHLVDAWYICMLAPVLLVELFVVMLCSIGRSIFVADVPAQEVILALHDIRFAEDKGGHCRDGVADTAEVHLAAAAIRVRPRASEHCRHQHTQPVGAVDNAVAGLARVLSRLHHDDGRVEAQVAASAFGELDATRRLNLRRIDPQVDLAALRRGGGESPHVITIRHALLAHFGKRDLQRLEARLGNQLHGRYDRDAPRFAAPASKVPRGR
mmetsp:Transcript_36952/g.118504  ORF Transcript_36952/g.118504 Transcript_36952/m.118504 type:complete len:213 (+) Transcript_36952:658-1296(+)